MKNLSPVQRIVLIVLVFVSFVLFACVDDYKGTPVTNPDPNNSGWTVPSDSCSGILRSLDASCKKNKKVCNWVYWDDNRDGRQEAHKVCQ